MKRQQSVSAFAKKKYAHCVHVERGGIGLRQLAAPEVERLQAHIDSIRERRTPRPIRLEVPA